MSIGVRVYAHMSREKKSKAITTKLVCTVWNKFITFVRFFPSRAIANQIWSCHMCSCFCSHVIACMCLLVSPKSQKRAKNRLPHIQIIASSLSAQWDASSVELAEEIIKMYKYILLIMINFRVHVHMRTHIVHAYNKNVFQVQRLCDCFFFFFFVFFISFFEFYFNIPVIIIVTVTVAVGVYVFFYFREIENKHVREMPVNAIESFSLSFLLLLISFANRKIKEICAALRIPFTIRLFGAHHIRYHSSFEIFDSHACVWFAVNH